jgi:hypothetical protein
MVPPPGYGLTEEAPGLMGTAAWTSGKLEKNPGEGMGVREESGANSEL